MGICGADGVGSGALAFVWEAVGGGEEEEEVGEGAEGGDKWHCRAI